MAASRRKIVAAAFEEIGLPVDRRAEDLADLFTDRREAIVRPFPGAIEALHTLRVRAVRLGLLTNGMAAPQRAKIDRLKLGPLFDAILIEEEFGVGKPDERMYLHLLGVSASAAWCVGDNLEWEVAAPQQLGIYSIWCDYREEGLPDASPVRPDRIICHVAELL